MFLRCKKIIDKNVSKNKNYKQVLVTYTKKSQQPEKYNVNTRKVNFPYYYLYNYMKYKYSTF